MTRQSHCAKDVEGRERALTVQQLVHNWGTTPLGVSQGNHTCYGNEALSSSCEDGGIALLQWILSPRVLTNQCRVTKL